MKGWMGEWRVGVEGGREGRSEGNSEGVREKHRGQGGRWEGRNAITIRSVKILTHYEGISTPHTLPHHQTRLFSHQIR